MTPHASTLDPTTGSRASRKSRKNAMKGRKPPRRRKLLLEQLEDRRLLAGIDPFASERLSLSSAETNAALATSALGDTETAGSGDRFLTVDSKAASPWIDRGDYYWADGRQVPLYRRLDEVVVGLREPVHDIHQAQFVLALASPVAQVEMSVLLDKQAVTVSGSFADLDAALQSMAQDPAVAWASPAFINGEAGLKQWITDEVIIALEPGVDPIEYFANPTYSGYRPIDCTTDQFVATVASGGGLAVLSLTDQLRSDPRVAWASPNSHVEAIKYTADPLYSSQWHLNNTGQSGGTADADVNAPEAWALTTGSSNVVVAVLDDGVQTNHPDLSIWQNSTEASGTTGVDDDGNGYIDDINGWNFVADTANPNPSHADDNHGTAVAGVIGEIGNNSLGGAGVAYGVQVMPIKMATGTTYATDAQLVSAIRYAGGSTRSGVGSWRGADVLNFSWSWVTNTAVTNAFSWTHTNGRSGKGVPIFFFFFYSAS